MTEYRLRHRLRQSQAMSACGGLSEHDCEKAFQHWVAHIRPQVSDESEQLMCPLLWCRNKFEGSQPTIRHTATCLWLPNACYWCPLCKKPERFWCSGKSREAVPSQLMRRKSSRMRKAKDFFKQFSRKNTARAKFDRRDERVNSIYGFDRKDEKYSRQRWEIYGKGISPVPELSGRGFVEKYGSKRTRSRTPQELMGSVTHKAKFPDSHSWPTYKLQSPDEAITSQELSTQEQTWIRAELPTPDPSHELPVLPDSSTELTEFSQTDSYVCCKSCSILAEESSSTLMLNQCPTPYGLGASEPPTFCTNHRQPDLSFQAHLPYCQLMAPLPEPALGETQIEPPESMQLIPQSCAQQTEMRSHADSEPIFSRNRETPANHWPSLTCVFGDVLGNDVSWPVRGDRFSLSDGLTHKQGIIQELYDLVEVVNEEWLQRLNSTPHLLSACSALAPSVLFYRGIYVMQRCFNDTLPSGFDDVFATMHVACACAYMLHRDNPSYCWDDFFDHMLLWQHVLSDEVDVRYFLMAMDQLSCEDSGCLNYSLCGRSFSDQRSYEQNLNMLRDGPIMKDCASLLDGRFLQLPVTLTT